MNKLRLSALAVVYVLLWSSNSYAQPVITSVGPLSGGIGTEVTIHGTNFANTTAVSFNGVSAATYGVVGGGTIINVEVAAGTTTGPVTVTAPGGTAASTMDFVVSDIPTITSFDPPSGGAGTVVTIHGINFVNTTAVSFNGISVATYSVVGGGTAIIAEVAAGTTTGPVTVTTPDGTATFTIDFVFSDVPTISSFGPPSGGVGTLVSIHGTNFANATAVSFNDVSAAAYSVVGGGAPIIAEVAAGTTTGPVTVTTSDGTATSTMDFVFSDVPTITSFDPPSGGVGTLVIIRGTNFANATAVSFNGISAVTYSVVGGGTVINAEVAAGTTTGPVAVTTPDGTATFTMDFVFSDVPTITSFNPPSGGVGTLVTIHGISFANATTVSFNDVSAAAFGVVAGGTVINAEVAAGTTTGPVTVTTPEGTATSSMDFVIDLPVVMPVVNIYVNPTSDSNCIDPSSNERILVGFLGNPTFDITDINVDTLRFDSRDLLIRSDPGAYCFSNDLNDDGTMDLFCHFQDSSPWVWKLGDGEGTVSGEFHDGTKFQATDSMCVVPRGKS